MILPKLTAIGSGKGGTGKTLAATTLAAVLAQRGERVLLCDADLGLSNTAVHLGLEDGGDLAGLLSDRVTLAEAVVPVMGGAGERGGFDLVAAPSGSGTLANLDPGIVDKLVAKLRHARAYDRILVDLSAGVDAIAMGIAARADETLLLLTADPASLTDAYAFVKLLLRARGRKPWVLVEPGRERERSPPHCRRARKDLPHLSQDGGREHRFHPARPPRLGCDPPATHADRDISAVTGRESLRTACAPPVRTGRARPSVRERFLRPLTKPDRPQRRHRDLHRPSSLSCRNSCIVWAQEALWEAPARARSRCGADGQQSQGGIMSALLDIVHSVTGIVTSGDYIALGIIVVIALALAFATENLGSLVTATVAGLALFAVALFIRGVATAHGKGAAELAKTDWNSLQAVTFHTILAYAILFAIVIAVVQIIRSVVASR